MDPSGYQPRALHSLDGLWWKWENQPSLFFCLFFFFTINKFCLELRFNPDCVMTHGCYWYKESLRSSVKCSQPLTSEGLIQSKLYMFYKHWGLGTARPMSMDLSQCPQSSRMRDCPTTTEPAQNHFATGSRTGSPLHSNVDTLPGFPPGTRLKRKQHSPEDCQSQWLHGEQKRNHMLRLKLKSTVFLWIPRILIPWVLKTKGTNLDFCTIQSYKSVMTLVFIFICQREQIQPKHLRMSWQ